MPIRQAMRRAAIFSTPWLAVHLLGILVMLHASVLLLYLERARPEQVVALGWTFLSMGFLGMGVSRIARRWLGSATVAWSGGVKFLGGAIFLVLAPSGHRVADSAVSLVILASGIAHWMGASRLKQADQRHLPFVFSGAVNVVVSAAVFFQANQKDAAWIILLVAGATFITGLSFFLYGRQLRRLANTSDSLMAQIRTPSRVSVRSTDVCI